MINAPTFAQTSDKGDMRTFAMGLPPDPRAINWHVDRYVRNIHFKKYHNVAEFPYALNNSFTIRAPKNFLMLDEWEACDTFEFTPPIGWEQNDYAGFVQTNCYSLSRKWFTNLKGDEWARHELSPKQTICPNLSLTRYDWHENSVPAYYKMGMKHSHSLPVSSYYQFSWKIPEWHRIPLLFGITEEQFFCGETEPLYLAPRNCGKLIHGPSWEIRNPDLARRLK